MFTLVHAAIVLRFALPFTKKPSCAAAAAKLQLAQLSIT